MYYTTTKCRNCGYVTRNHESSVPKVQLGKPLIECPHCHNLILDDIQTEYEFMTESERRMFEPKVALRKTYISNIIIIIFCVFLLGLAISVGHDAALLIFIFGGIGIGFSLYNIFRNHKLIDNKMIEQEIYLSLKRTSNKGYVKFIQKVYRDNGIDRVFMPMDNKKQFMEIYKYFETSERYRLGIKNFKRLIQQINNDINVNKSKDKTNIL